MLHRQGSGSRNAVHPLRGPAAIAEALEPGIMEPAVLDSPTTESNMPNQVPGEPRRSMNFLRGELGQMSVRSTYSCAGGPPGVEVSYDVTLHELNQRSYFQLHELREPKLSALQGLQNALKQAIAVANLEVLLHRNIAKSGQPVSARHFLDLNKALAQLSAPADNNHNNAHHFHAHPAPLRPPADEEDMQQVLGSLPADPTGGAAPSSTNLRGGSGFGDGGNLNAAAAAAPLAVGPGALSSLDLRWAHRKLHTCCLQVEAKCFELEAKLPQEVTPRDRGLRISCGPNATSCSGDACQPSPASRNSSTCRSHLLSDLQQMIHIFAAYLVSAFDDEVKEAGTVSPYLASTPSMDKIQALVCRDQPSDAGDGGRGGRGGRSGRGMVRGPKRIAEVALTVVRCLRGLVPAFNVEAEMLTAAFLSGHSELVTVLLKESSSRLDELAIIRRLVRAWNGYTSYGILMEPLQASRARVGPDRHTMDLLDFKNCSARAIIIAHEVLQKLVITKGGLESIDSLIHPAAPPPVVHASTDPADDPSNSGRRRSRFAVPLLPGLLRGGSGGRDGAKADAAAAADNRGALPSPQAAVSPGAHVVAFDEGAAAGDAAAGGDVVDETELTDKKWTRVMLLFARPAACKPLALAMVYLVLAGKKAKRAEDREAEGGGHGGLSASASQGQGMGGNDSDDEEAAAEEEERRKQEAEKLKSMRYASYHKMAVQACHLAVHSTSLAVVSDALRCVKAVRAWPAINLDMLNDLAAHFPVECSQLLGMIRLEEVDLEDNVLPFAVPSNFITVAVSDKDTKDFREEGGSGSTQDAVHFSSQNTADASIEASLLVQSRAWLSLIFLFWPREFRTPTTQLLVRVYTSAVVAFMCQGIGSTCVAILSTAAVALLGCAVRSVAAVLRIAYFGLLRRLWNKTAGAFPELELLRRRLQPRYNNAHPAGGKVPGAGTGKNLLKSSEWSTSVAPSGPSAAAAAARHGKGGKAVHPGGDEDDPNRDDGGSAGEEMDPLDMLMTMTKHGMALPVDIGAGLWKEYVAKGHDGLIDKALGWGSGSTSISCRKVPLPLPYATDLLQPQMDTMVMEKLLRARNVHPSVFGTPVMRAMILFKWNFFTKYFILLQLALHVTYMAVFVGYAFTLKDLMEVEGRDSGPGANRAGCRLPPPTTTQTVLLITLAVMTTDFLWQELRQIWHFGPQFFKHTWDLLDVASIAVVMASLILHFSCTGHATPSTLRGLAAVQIILLFLRLLYYAMASDKLGSFVRMVLETVRDLLLFFAFLAVIFVGFVIATVISQGPASDTEQTFIKLFTMVFGDFDTSFLGDIESGALGLDSLTRVLASFYMIFVTIILLNLLIAIINESYERIRENEQWESLRNKALLVVESETQLFSLFLRWLYNRLCPTSKKGTLYSRRHGNRWLYVITPERARRVRTTPDAEDGADDSEDEEDEEPDEEGEQWNGRMGELKRHTTTQVRSVHDYVRREMGKLSKALEDVQEHIKAAAGHDGSGENDGSIVTGFKADGERGGLGSRTGSQQQLGHGGSPPRSLRLDEDLVNKLTLGLSSDLSQRVLRHVESRLPEVVEQQVRLSVERALAVSSAWPAGVGGGGAAERVSDAQKWIEHLHPQMSEDSSAPQRLPHHAAPGPSKTTELEEEP